MSPSLKDLIIIPGNYEILYLIRKNDPEERNTMNFSKSRNPIKFSWNLSQAKIYKFSNIELVCWVCICLVNWRKNLLFCLQSEHFLIDVLYLWKTLNNQPPQRKPQLIDYSNHCAICSTAFKYVIWFTKKEKNHRRKKVFGGFL